LNQTLHTDQATDTSALTIDIQIEEAWIRKMIRKDNRTFTLRDKQFDQISVSLNPDLVTIGAKVVGKENSTVGISIRPKWNASQQKLIVEDVLLQTKTTNIILKSMGWIASNFMQEKINDKIEEAAKGMFEKYLAEYTAKPVIVPLKEHGTATANVKSVIIHSIAFVEKAIVAKISITGNWKVSLAH
jgi:hypothetical protein